MPLALEVRYIADPADPPVKIDLQRINDGELEQIEFADSRTVAAGKPLRMPRAYVVHAHQAEIGALLDQQGIHYRKIEKPRNFQGVEFVAGPEWSATGAAASDLMETMPNVTLDEARERRVRLQARPGDLWIDLDQQRGRLAALILEPSSKSSLFRGPEYFPLVTAGQKLPIYRVPR